MAGARKTEDVNSILRRVPAVIRALGDTTPLSHNMTNLVVRNFAANVALAVGASPIMANYGQEAGDLCKLGGSLVINMGRVTPEGIRNYLQALQAYNLVGSPVVFDPVATGATKIRRDAIKTLMAGGYFDLIKGNEREIKNAFGEVGTQQRGVDSGPSTLNAREKVTLLIAAIAGLLHYEIAAEVAVEREDFKGPGTFVAALIDELYNIHSVSLQNDIHWLRRAKVEAVELQRSREGVN